MTIGPAERSAMVMDVDVVCKGIPIDEATMAYAKHKIHAAARTSEAPVLFGRLKITHEEHRSIARPVIVAITLDVDGHLVRAHAAGRTTREAVDMAEERLRRQLREVRQRLAFLRRRAREGLRPGEWRHGDVPSARPEPYHRAPEERRIVRRKSFPLDRIAPENAAVEMELLDHDFHLFVDSDTGRDAVVRRLSGDSYELSRVAGEREDATNAEFVAGRSPQTMTLRAAVDRLNATEERLMFFIDIETSRGAVLYRRYDGHYGLVTGSTEAEIERSDRR